MTTTDWIIDIALILIVVRQLREERLTRRFVIVPAAIVCYVKTYLHAIPTDGNNLTLIAVFVAAGATLGLIGGLLTRVRGESGAAYVKAGPTAAALWIASMTARLGFIIWITHSSGESAIAHFSATHHISAADTWQTGLVLLALSEVVVRVATVVVRGLLAADASKATSGQPVDSSQQLISVR